VRWQNWWLPHTTQLTALFVMEGVAPARKVAPVLRLRWGVATAFHTEEAVH
jgi:hypothetical protein